MGPQANGAGEGRQAVCAPCFFAVNVDHATYAVVCVHDESSSMHSCTHAHLHSSSIIVCAIPIDGTYVPPLRARLLLILPANADTHLPLCRMLSDPGTHTRHPCHCAVSSSSSCSPSLPHAMAAVQCMQQHLVSLLHK